MELLARRMTFDWAILMVSEPDERSGGVIQYDFGKTVQYGQFIRTGSLNRPPSVLLSAVNTLQARHRMEEPELTKYLAEMMLNYPKMREGGTYPGPNTISYLRQSKNIEQLTIHFPTATPSK